MCNGILHINILIYAIINAINTLICTFLFKFMVIIIIIITLCSTKNTLFDEKHKKCSTKDMELNIIPG